MGDAAGELAERLHLLRLGEPLLRLEERSLGLRLAQILVGALAHRDVGAEHQARHRGGDHEHEQQQERIVEVRARERAAAGERPQTAKPDRTSATVAVSRGARRSADHSNGTTARKPSGAVCAVCSTSGLKAIRPTAQAPARTAALSARSRRPPCRRACRPQDEHRRDHQRAGEIAQPPGQPDRADIRPIGEPRERAGCRPRWWRTIAVGTKLSSENRAMPAGVAKVSRPLDQRLTRKAADHAFQVLPAPIATEVASEPAVVALAMSAARKIAGQTR